MAEKIKHRHASPSVPFGAANYPRNEAEMVAYGEEMLVDDRALPITLRTLHDALLQHERSPQGTDASGISITAC